MRYSQNPEQRPLGHVGFIRYDPLDRPWITGVDRPAICSPDDKTGDPEGCWNQLDPNSTEPAIPDVSYPGLHWEWLGSNRRTQYAYEDQPITGWPFEGDTGFTQQYTAGRPKAVAHRTDGLWDSPNSRWQTTQYSYNAQGLVGERRERVYLSSGTPWDMFTYSYNQAGMLTQDRVTVGSRVLRHQYQYDRRGLLTTVSASSLTSGPLGAILSLEYAIDGAVTERRLGGGTGQTTVPYAYDVAGRIHEIGDVATTNDPFAAKYTYTPSGLISRIETRSAAAAQSCLYSSEVCSPRWTYAFTYDGLARLTGAIYDPVPPGRRVTGYTVSNLTYDRQGNIETLTRNAPTTANPTGMIVDQLTYQYTPRTNRLEAVADAVTTDLDWDAKPSTFLYNRVGSMTQMTETLPGSISRTTSVQRYDERQLPEHLTITRTQGLNILSVQQVHYRYDVNGQRIRKEITGPGALTERYVRDGMRLVGVFDENNDLKSWNLGGASGLVGRGEPLPMTGNLAFSYYVTDHLGSIRAVVNHSGIVIEGRDYYPYGLTMPGRFYISN